MQMRRSENRTGSSSQQYAVHEPEKMGQMYTGACGVMMKRRRKKQRCTTPESGRLLMRENGASKNPESHIQ